jgi:hypothetical protein
LWAGPVLGGQQSEESVDRFRQLFRLSITIYYYYKRTPGGLPQKNRIESFRGGGQARKGRAIARGNAANSILKGRMLAQVQKEVSNGRMDQG